MSFSAPMSTNPDIARRADDRIVTLLSRWLARHVDDAELESAVREIGTSELSREQAEAVEELLAELERPTGTRADLEMLVRETLEALALGG
jgi:hypothetical protein